MMRRALTVALSLSLTGCVVAPNWQRQLVVGALDAFADPAPLCVASAHDFINNRDFADDLRAALKAEQPCASLSEVHYELKFRRAMEACVDCGDAGRMESTYAELIRVGSSRTQEAVAVFTASDDRPNEELIASLALAVNDWMLKASRRRRH